MSENVNRRHPNVVNRDELEPRNVSKGTKFGAAIYGLARAADSERLGCNLFEVPAGRSAFPCHYHCGVEEAIYIIGGQGNLRLGAERVDVREGDFIAMPVGPDHAHRLDNTGSEPLRYLCFSTRATADVVGYPDSNKIAAAGSGSNDFFAKPWIRGIYPEESQLEYYDGEETD